MGFLDKLLKKDNTQFTNFGRLVEKIGKGSSGNLLGDGLGSVKDLVNGVGASLSDLTKSKNDRNNVDRTDTNFHTREVALANLHSDAILDILKGVTNGNLMDAGLKALQLYNYGTKWTIVTDQYVDKEMYSFRYTYLNERDFKAGNLVESETDVVTRELLDSIEDPTILGYTVKFDFENSPLFDLVNYNNDSPTAQEFVSLYQNEYPEMSECIANLKVVRDMCQQIFESGESLSGLAYQKNRKQHYILSIDGIQKLDNPFVDFKEDELKVTLNEDVRLYTNKLAFAYRNLSFSKAYGKKLIPENLLRFNMYIKISDQRTFTRNMGEKDALRDAMRNAYSRIIYELKDCEMSFENSLPNEMTMGSTGAGAVDTGFAKVIMKIKYRKVNRIFYSAMFDNDFKDFTETDKFHINDDQKARDFLVSTKFEDRRISEVGKMSSKRRSTSNNIDVVPSLASQYSTLKSRGLFTTDDNDSAVTRFIKTLGNQVVQKGVSYVDEGLSKVQSTIDKLGLGVRDKLQSLVKTNTVSLGNINDGFIATVVTTPSVSNVNTRSSYYNNGDGVIGLLNLATNPADVNPIYYQNLNNQRYYQNTQVIGLENLASDPATATEIYYHNLNSGRYYSNVGAIGLQNLSNDKVAIVPIRMEDLAVGYTPITKIEYHNLNGTAYSTIEAPKGDLMNGFDATPGLTVPVDLMVTEGKPAALTVTEDLMVADVTAAGLTVPVDLMNSFSATPGLTAPVDLMIAEGKPVTLTVAEDLMVADVTVAGLKVSVDLMIADVVPAGLSNVQDLMVADVLTEMAPKGDLMIAVSDGEAIKAVNLMVSKVEISPIQAQDLMIATTVTPDMQEEHLMQPVDALEPIPKENLMTGEIVNATMTTENLMTVTATENIMQKENLMTGDAIDMTIKFEDLMVVVDESTPLLDDNLMVIVPVPGVIELEDLMVVRNEALPIGREDLMVAVDESTALTEDHLMRTDISAADLSQIDNVNPVTGNGVEAPNVENLMQVDNFKRFLKKKE